MPRARNRWERATQVMRWIEANWPIGRPVRIKFPDIIIDEDTLEPCEGQCYREGREIVIEIAKRMNPLTRIVVDTVIHECAHAILWPPARAEGRQAHHPPAFWAQYGEIRDRFDHDFGWEHAADYPTE